MQAAQSNHSLATAVLVEKQGRFYVYQPGIALIASDDSVAGAYRKFDGVRRAFIEEVERFGLVGRPLAEPARDARPAGPSAGRSVAAELGIFVVKCCIVVLLVAGLPAALLAGLAPREGVSFADVASKVTEIARDVQALPPESKEALRQGIGALARELAPVIEAWRNPPPASEPKSDPGAPAATNKPGR